LPLLRLLLLLLLLLLLQSHLFTGTSCSPTSWPSFTQDCIAFTSSSSSFHLHLLLLPSCLQAQAVPYLMAFITHKIVLHLCRLHQAFTCICCCCCPVFRHKLFPYLMAFYQLGQQQLPAAEWMHAMLKYGKVRHRHLSRGRQHDCVSLLTVHAMCGAARYAKIWQGDALPTVIPLFSCVMGYVGMIEVHSL
jgi:hypothetical protein